MADPPPKGSQDMSEPDKPKRRFWQFHLSTAILMTVAAGGLFGLNLTKHIGYRNVNMMPLGAPESVYFSYPYHGQGWPFAFWWTLLDDETGSKYAFTGWDLIADLSICVAILASIFFVSESIIRRREARKT
jgi:hypothetical protein